MLSTSNFKNKRITVELNYLKTGQNLLFENKTITNIFLGFLFN